MFALITLAFALAFALAPVPMPVSVLAEAVPLRTDDHLRPPALGAEGDAKGICTLPVAAPRRAAGLALPTTGL